MGTNNYYSKQDEWNSIEASYAIAVGFAPFASIKKHQEIAVHKISIFDVLADKKKKILEQQKKEADKLRREREEQRKIAIENKRLEEERKRHRQQALLIAQREKEAKKKHEREVLEQKILQEKLKRQKEQEEKTRRAKRYSHIKRQNKAGSESQANKSHKTEQTKDENRKRSSTGLLKGVLLFLVVAGIIYAFYEYSIISTKKTLTIELRPELYSNYDNVEHVIDSYLNKRDDLIHGNLHVITDEELVDITLQGDFGIKDYYPGISLPVGLYKITAKSSKGEITTDEYVSTNEDKQIAILFNAKKRAKERTVKDLYRLINKYPNAVNLYTERAIKLVRNKDYLNAINFLDSSISKFPKAAELYSNKARILSTDKFYLNEKMFKREDSLKMAWKSIELNPSTRMLDGLSEALAANSEYDLAIKLQQTIEDNLDNYFSIFNSANTRFTLAIDEKINAYKQRLLWTSNGEITNKATTKIDALKESIPVYTQTSEYSEFIDKANGLKGKYVTKEYCEMYVRIGMRQYENNIQRKCKLENENDPNHPRWSSDSAGHASFCNKYSVYASSKEVIIRENSLRSCR